MAAASHVTERMERDVAPRLWGDRDGGAVGRRARGGCGRGGQLQTGVEDGRATAATDIVGGGGGAR